MFKKYSIPALLAGSIVLLAFPDDPPNGHTGAPSELTCADCHTLNGGTQDGIVTVTGMPALIEPNTSYNLTVTSSNPNGIANIAGFQITILNSLNLKAGTLSLPSAGSELQTEGGRQYWEHNTPAAYPGSNMVSWTASWLSPTAPANTTITYYIANNVANGNGDNTGDLIITTSGGGMLNGGGTNLAVSITNSTNVLCNGQNTGSATALATGGATPYMYIWNTGGTGTTISNLVAGIYRVTVTDNEGSTASASVTITQPPLLVLQPPGITNVSCNGGNNGSIQASASGGVGPYSFDWSNGSGNAAIFNLTAGPYTVTVTDANDCTKSATYTVTQPALIVISLFNLTHESCDGDEDGSITISVAGGANPIFIEWSNGFIGSTINNLSPGSYSVTVTDNNDCTKTASYTVNPGGNPDVTLNQIQNVTCAGGANGSISVTAFGGFGPYTYEWSNGATGPIVTGLTAGSYLVTVTDSHDCIVVKGYTVTQPPAIVVQIMQPTQNLCAGDSTADLTSTVVGGVAPYTAIWSNGTIGLSNPNLHAGTYTITVTDASLCTSTKSAVITDPPQLTVIVSTTDETAVGLNNGTATAAPGGGSPGYTYLWSNGATTSTITGLSPGSYTVTVTDANGCTVSGTGQVDAFGCSLDVILGQDLVICEGDTVTITPGVTGAAGSVTFLWSNGSTSASIQVSEGGEYCVTVTDGSNCQDVDCIIITEIIIPALTCPVTNESSPGANDGAINCTGIPTIVSYSWSNGANTSLISGLAAGQYCVTVVDNNGCSDSQCFIVQPGNCQLTITEAITNVTCAGGSTGSILIAANNVIAPIVYLWSNGETTSIINNLTAGNYSVTVSDASGCIVTDSYTISEPDSMVITVDSIAPVQDFDSGLIWITVNGGVPPYTYFWVDPSGGNFNSEDLNNLLVPGDYAVTVTDAEGCVVTRDSITVGVDVALDPVERYKSLKVYPVPTEDVLFISMEDPMIEVLISGADGRLYKRIQKPATNKLDVSELESGWYILRIWDGENWYIARMVK